MNIIEIESTLNSLRTRHPNLDEALLTTLLTSSGWEEKTIKEALVVFKGLSKEKEKIVVPAQTPAPVSTIKIVENKIKETESVNVVKPSTNQIEKIENVNTKTSDVVNVQSEKDIALKSENKEGKVDNTIDSAGIVYFNNNGEEERELKTFIDDGKDVPVIKDPESLILPLEEIKIPNPAQNIEPPENLPLKPFESAPHVWPFSRYKEVFHGDTMPTLPSEEQKLVEEHKDHVIKKVKIKRTRFDAEDEGLIFLTGMTLLIILLLLAYMYSNGRL